MWSFVTHLFSRSDVFAFSSASAASSSAIFALFAARSCEPERERDVIELRATAPSPTVHGLECSAATQKCEAALLTFAAASNRALSATAASCNFLISAPRCAANCFPRRSCKEIQSEIAEAFRKPNARSLQETPREIA